MKHRHLSKQLHRQQGAALVVGLILLVVVTVLAVSGMNTATTELAMARNDQNTENAFQAAETGIETALARPTFDTGTPTVLTPTIPGGHEEVTATIAFRCETMVPDDAYSIGTGVGAFHFDAVADAKSKRIAGGSATDRDASARHTQAFYIIGAGGGPFSVPCS